VGTDRFAGLPYGMVVIRLLSRNFMNNNNSVKKLGTLCFISSLAAALAIVISGECRIYTETQITKQVLLQIPLLKKQVENLEKIIIPINEIISDTKEFVDPIGQKVDTLNETVKKTHQTVDKLKKLADGVEKLPYVGESLKSFIDSIDQWTHVIEATGKTIHRIANNSSKSLSATREMFMYASEIIPQILVQIDQMKKTIKILNLFNQIASRLAYWLTGTFFAMLGLTVKRIVMLFTNNETKLV
jgi:methyl-accepting chemotaxis protein